MTAPHDESREQAIHEWETGSSVSGGAGKKTKRKIPWLVIGGTVVVAGLGFALLTDSAPKAPKKDQPNVAGRQQVDALKSQPQESHAPVPVQSTTAVQEAAPVSVAAAPSGPSPEELKARAMREARLRSSLVASISDGGATASPSASMASDSGQDADPNTRFAARSFSQQVGTNEAVQLDGLEYRIQQGKLIDAVLESGINSDLPGTIRAIVQSPVYGEQGAIPLIPYGSRLIGSYNARIRKGQSRVFIVWNRVMLPNGVNVKLDSYGTDAFGRSGLAGDVNHHFGQVFGVSALLSIIGAGASNYGVSSGDRDNSAARYREAVSDSFADSAESVLEQYAGIPPTITVKPGSRVRVFVNRDLDFSTAYSSDHSTAERSRGAGVLSIFE